MPISIPRREADRVKPPYVVPTMQEIIDLDWNGFNAVSTFSGCGGSSTGYRMAGFRVLYANEFVEAARDTYRANAADYTFLDDRDIRDVRPEDIFNATGLGVGEIDLFDGSPPCANFSSAGKREKAWGKVKKYSDREQRSDDLFFEFARLIEGTKPKTFVAENVSGLIKGTAKGYFIDILAALKACGYRVSCKLLDAQWLGVPQARQRTIFIGVRDDLGLAPCYPKPLAYRYSIRDALPWINRQRVGGRVNTWRSSDQPAGTIVASDHSTSLTAWFSSGGYIEADADMSKYAVGREWSKLKLGQQSDKYFQLVKCDPNAPSGTVTARGDDASVASISHPYECRKYSISELRRICGFPDDFVLTGTYAQQWERLGRSVPPVMMSHIAATVRDEILRKATT